MVEIKLNNINFTVEANISVLEASEYVGFDVPRFCYHQNLSIAGNCRMCLVEIANLPKPIASCALPILNNMKVFVNSPLVQKARENILEVLLLKHPLDCPICDQAGECDLQDQSKAFGLDSNRFFFKKRFVDDKLFSPLIKTIMTRCIHCTRCVRYNSEITGNECIGTLARGASTEIGSYYNNASLYLTEMSANVIDLCPVGALTLKNYAFKARPWELKTLESIDLSDSFGSNIYVSFKESRIVRIFPKSNLELNENFISDKARVCYDSQINNRAFNLIKIRDFKNKIFECLIVKLKISFITNNSLDLENLFFIKTLRYTTNNFSSSSIKNAAFTKLNFFISWINNFVSELELKSELCFIICSNINVENSLLANKIRVKNFLNNLVIFGFCLNNFESSNLNFLNLNFDNLFLKLESKSFTANFFLIYSNPLFLFNESVTKRGINLFFFFNIIKRVLGCSTFFKIQTLNDTLSQFNCLAINSKLLDKSNILFFIKLEDSFNVKKYFIDIRQKRLELNKFFSLTSHLSNLIPSKCQFSLPTEYEQEEVHMHSEERFQKTSKIVSPYNTNSFKELILSFFNFFS